MAFQVRLLRTSQGRHHGGLRKLPGEQGVPERYAFGGGTATGLVNDLLIAGHQLGAGEGVQHRPGPDLNAEVTRIARGTAIELLGLSLSPDGR